MISPLPTGESIEVLDIGLRKSRDHRAVHRVKPSSPAHRLAAGDGNIVTGCKVHHYTVEPL